jgi:hypothetical protein
LSLNYLSFLPYNTESLLNISRGGYELKDLNLKFLNAINDEFIPFLPFGVTTIEFTFDGNTNSGYVRPVNSTLNDKKSKKFVGFPENNRDFLIVWGAGKHEGQYVSENSTNRLFMQLIHLQGNHAEAIIKFKHTGVLGRTKTLKVQSAIPLESFKDVVKMKIDEDDSEKKEMTFTGTLIPLYYARWFPPQKISYLESADHPEIHIDYKEDESGIVSPIKISVKSQGQRKKICEVGGDLRYSNLHGEMFALLPEKEIFVLRLWMYWIHKKFRKGILGFSVDDTPDIEKKTLGFGDSISGLEIPDIERFDFVIDAKKSKIIRYGTDFHYQEYWGEPENTLVEANIAKNMAILVKTLKLWPLRKIQDSDLYDPIDEVKDSILKKIKAESLPLIASQEKPVELKKLGIYPRAHVPYIDPSKIGMKNDMEDIKKFLSSDSRRGAKLR